MNTDRLSLRLQTVASYIPENSRLADIGSDHAFLPCHMVKNGMISYAVAGEVAEGPFQSALGQVKAEGLEGKVFVRKGDGLEVITAGEVDCVTIAGMGGTLIASILERGRDKLGQVKRLVLQPNVTAAAVRTWLVKNGWELFDEMIIKEDKKIYEILAAERGNAGKPYSDNMDAELLLGPFLMKKKSDVFIEKWTAEKTNWQRIIRELQRAGNSADTLKKKEELLLKIQMVEEALNGENNKWA